MTRLWIPAAHVDEISPAPRPTPSDWILTLPGDAYALAPAEDDPDDAPPPRILHDGDRVNFSWFEGHGTAIFRIDAAGNWSVDRDPPAEITNVCALGNADTLAYGHGREALEEFARQWIEAEDGHPEATETTILYYAWSHQPVPYLFRAGSFEPANG